MEVEDKRAACPQDQGIVREEIEVRHEFVYWNKAVISFMAQNKKILG